MYTLFIGNKNFSSWSLRPWLLMQELQIDFDEQLMPFTDGGSWDQFREFSPTGMVPCLHDDARVVWESLGIVEYLADRHAGVWPSDGDAKAWARCATAEMHSGFSHLRNLCPMTVGQRIALHETPDGLKKDLERLQELWQQGLERFAGPFLAGADFCAVDAFFAPVAFRVQTFGLDLSTPCTAYVQHLLGLSGMQAWQSAALLETFTEPSHEAEIAQLGTLIEDLRQPARS